MTPHASPRNRLPATALLGACLGALILPAPPAEAQLLPLLPMPVSTTELMECADVLGLSDEQRLAALTVHDQYLERYRQFEETDARPLRDEFLTVVTRAMAGGFKIPERKELENLVAGHTRAFNKVETIDRSLFDGLAPMLTEEQLVDLPEARTAREASNYREVAADIARNLNPGAGVDLSEIARGLELTPDEQAASGPLLAAYRSNRLVGLRRTYRVLLDAVPVILDVIDRLRLREMSQMEMFELMMKEETQLSLRETFDEASKPFQAEVYDLSQLNRRTYGPLRAGLGGGHAEELRERYYGAAYPEVYPGPAEEWRRRYAEALAIEDLDAELAGAVRARLEEYARQDDHLLDALAGEIEESRKYRTTSMLDDSTPEERREKIDELGERRETLAAGALAALDGLLGAELVARLETRGKDHALEDGEEIHEIAVTVSAGGTSVETSDGEESRRGRRRRERQERMARALLDPSLEPRPLDRRDLDLLDAILGDDEEQRAIVAARYEDYEQEIGRLEPREEQDDEAAREGAAAPAPSAPAPPAPAPPAPAPTAARDARATLLGQIHATDEAFFGDVAVLASGADEERLVGWVREMRRREVAGGAARAVAPSFGDEEAQVDIVRIVLEADLDEAARSGLSDLLEGYAASLRGLLEERLEAAEEYRRRMRLQERVTERGGEGSRDVAEAVAERVREAMRAVHRVDKRIIQLNRESIAPALQALPEPVAWDLRFAYNEAAYPDIFAEGDALETTFGRALELPDLTGDQRRAIEELAGTYRADYFEMSERMLALRTQRSEPWAMFEFPKREVLERELDLESIRQRRAERTDRAKVRLALSLGEEQRRRLDLK